jgi:hypothetical protein
LRGRWSRIDDKQSNGSLSRSSSMLSLKGENTWGGLGSINGNGVQEV